MSTNFNVSFPTDLTGIKLCDTILKGYKTYDSTIETTPEELWESMHNKEFSMIFITYEVALARLEGKKLKTPPSKETLENLKSLHKY